MNKQQTKKDINNFINSFFNRQTIIFLINSEKRNVYHNRIKTKTILTNKNKTFSFNFHLHRGSFLNDLIYLNFTIETKGKIPVQQKEIIIDIRKDYENDQLCDHLINYVSEFVEVLFNNFGRDFCFNEMNKYIVMSV